LVNSELDPSDPDVARLTPKLRRGDLSKMSFSFSVKRDEWEHGHSDNDLPRRKILEIEALRDVSVVTRPAYSGTEVALRSLEAAKPPQEIGAVLGAARRMRMQLALLG
jgi:HK97 family phage prohead protease